MHSLASGGVAVHTSDARRRKTFGQLAFEPFGADALEVNVASLAAGAQLGRSLAVVVVMTAQPRRLRSSKDCSSRSRFCVSASTKRGNGVRQRGRGSDRTYLEGERLSLYPVDRYGSFVEQKKMAFPNLSDMTSKDVVS
jgi:hypothetical protein